MTNVAEGETQGLIAICFQCGIKYPDGEGLQEKTHSLFRETWTGLRCPKCKGEIFFLRPNRGKEG